MLFFKKNTRQTQAMQISHDSGLRDLIRQPETKEEAFKKSDHPYIRYYLESTLRTDNQQ